MSATSISVLVPLTIRKSGRRKIVVAPDGCVITGTSRQARTPSDPALVKALARAFHYQRMLDDGRYRSISDMAAAEQLDRGYLGRLLLLTLLAPDLVQAIMDGRQPVGVTLPMLMEPFPVDWLEQRRLFTDCFSRTGRPLSGLISTATDLLGNGAESCGVGITRDDCCTAVPFSSTCAYRSANNTLRSSLRVRTAGCQSGSTAPSNVKAVVGSRFLT